MDSVSLLAGIAVGALLGAVIGFLYARSRLTGTMTDLTAEARAADERAKAEDPAKGEAHPIPESGSPGR